MRRLHSVRLVGRDAETEQLRRLAREARDGALRLVLVEGEAGIGKTRLVTDAIARMREPDDLVAQGAGVALAGDEAPYLAVASVLRDLVRQVGPDAVREAGGPALGVLLPGLRVESDRPPEPTRAEVHDAVASLLERLTARRLLWLVLEDLQWVDASTRELLAHLARTLRDARVVLLCTRRTHDGPSGRGLQDLVAELVRHPGGGRMTLRRLDEAGVAEQVTGILGALPDAGTVAAVAARSEGNPFLTEEVLAAADDGWEGVDELLMRRLRGLGAAAREVVQAAAVGEGHVEHGLLGPVCGLEPDELADAVGALVAASVLETRADGDSYDFRHALLREAVERSLLPAERERWHRRWAEELESGRARLDPGRALVAAAQHWSRTDDAVRALHATLRAEHAAWAMRASPEQARLSLRVAELLPRVPEQARPEGLVRLDCVWTAVVALLRSGDWAEADAVARRELRRPDTAREPGWRIYLELVLRTCAERRGRAAAPLDVERDVAELLAAPENNLVTEALLWYHDVLLEVGREDEADRLLGRAQEVAATMVARERSGELRPTNDPPDGVSTGVKGEMTVQVHVAVRAWDAGRSDEGITRVQALVPLARRPGAYDGPDHTVLRVAAGMLRGVGRAREALTVLQDALDLLGGPDTSRGTWLELVTDLAVTHLGLGEWDEVERWLRVAEPVPGSAEALAVVRAALCCGRGDAAAVLRALTASQEPRETAPRTWLAAEATALQGDHVGARELLEPSWDLADRDLEGWWPVADLFLLAARLEADAPDATDAAGPARVARIRERADRQPERGALGAAWRAHLEAELQRYGGGHDPAPWRAASDAWGVVEDPHRRAWAELRYAESLLALGEVPAGTGALETVLALARPLGARPLLDAVARAAERAGVGSVGGVGGVGRTAAPRATGAVLTPREREVLRLVAEGCSNDGIAERLVISPKTAGVHVSHILAKLEVPSRTAAAALAIRQGLLEDPDEPDGPGGH